MDNSEDIEALKAQVTNLKTVISTLQLEAENKELRLAKIAREKEKLGKDLLKTRRSNVGLMQQMEDERRHYFKEKEAYVREMNEYKQLKKVLSGSDIPERLGSEAELTKVKKSLEKTLHINYNLSIKFLKMKRTKVHLSRQLDKAEDEYGKVVSDLRAKIENLSREMNDVLKQKFKTTSLSPSNKKYLQLVNQNSSLLYENLCLQIKIDEFNQRQRRKTIERTRSENSHFTSTTNGTTGKSSLRHRKSAQHEEEPLLKIYERERTTGVPTVTYMTENEKRRTNKTSGKITESKLSIFQVSDIQSSSSCDTNYSRRLDQEKRRTRSKSAPKIVQSVTFREPQSNYNKSDARFKT